MPLRIPLMPRPSSPRSTSALVLRCWPTELLVLTPRTRLVMQEVPVVLHQGGLSLVSRVLRLSACAVVSRYLTTRRQWLLSTAVVVVTLVAQAGLLPLETFTSTMVGLLPIRGPRPITRRRPFELLRRPWPEKIWLIRLLRG